MVWYCLTPRNIIFRKRTVVTSFQSTHASYVVHVPSAEIVSVTLHFTYPTQLVEATGMKTTSRNFVPTEYESDITMRALTAAGLSRSYASTVVRAPGLLVYAPVSPLCPWMLGFWLSR